MHLPVEYRVARKKAYAAGRIVNISSHGALVTTSADSPLPKNANVEMFISWPVLLFEKVRLNLVAVGRVVRVEQNQAAITFERSDFRTASSQFRHPPVGPESSARCLAAPAP